MQDTNPIQWAVRPFQRYADFNGRAPRAEYWWYVLSTGIVGLLLGVVDAAFLSGHMYGKYGPLGLSFTIACVVPGLAVLIRRLHDTDRSGWWALVRIPSYAFILSGSSPTAFAAELKAVPITALIILVIAWIGVSFTVFLFVINAGTEGANRYGPDPYGPDQLEEVFA